MTHLAGEIAIAHGFPICRVIGSGTMLDTARFRSLLGQHFRVDSRHVHGYVIGEHGDSELLVWSHATIAGLSPQEYGDVVGIKLDQAAIADIDDKVRRAAYRIIEGKGATYYGIGSALARVVDVILNDQRSILTICSRMSHTEGISDVTISIPHLLGGDGVISPIPLSLTAEESAAFDTSASIIRAAVASLQLETHLAIS